MSKTNVFLKECQVQKTNQYDAFVVWDQLKISVPLHLQVYKENGQEPRSMFKDDELELFYKVSDDEKKIKNPDETFKYKKDRYCIGVLSSEDSESIIKYVEAGCEDLFYVVISKFDPEEDESKRMQVAIFIKGRE